MRSVSAKSASVFNMVLLYTNHTVGRLKKSSTMLALHALFDR